MGWRRASGAVALSARTVDSSVSHAMRMASLSAVNRFMRSVSTPWGTPELSARAQRRGAEEARAANMGARKAIERCEAAQLLQLRAI